MNRWQVLWLIIDKVHKDPKILAVCLPCIWAFDKTTNFQKYTYGILLLIAPLWQSETLPTYIIVIAFLF